VQTIITETSLSSIRGRYSGFFDFLIMGVGIERPKCRRDATCRGRPGADISRWSTCVTLSLC
jgi:hypothetical protein